MHYENIQPAVFLSRPNRFTALCRNGEGEELVCHLRNIGRCAELLLPGTRVWVQYHPSPTRKTQYTLITVEKGSQLVNLDSLAPNRLFAEGARSGLIQIDGVGELRELRSEVKADDSRLDHRLTGSLGTAYCEIKGVTLERDAVALFPDAPTLRGLKHVEELITLRGRGYAAAAVFLIQMEGVRCFTPNTGAQPEFHRALCRAREAGVQLLAFRCRVRPDEVEVLAPVEVRL